tara:strand:+ start:3056 stop:3412 length:357 start_codon:yes stop_codon:yes gene_type:complete
MGMTNIYMGSLRYGPTGKRRKNHAANPVRKKRAEFKPMKIDPIKTQRAMEAAAEREKQKEEFLARLSQMKSDITAKKEPLQYTGERKLVGIATMHKSNAVPIFEDDLQHAKDIARMRR